MCLSLASQSGRHGRIGLSRRTSTDCVSNKVSKDLMNYSDFYRFLVSLGVLLMGMAFVLPWLLLRESSNLLLDASKIAALTPGMFATDVSVMRASSRL